MNRLVLIGNGFDLAHGLPTSYQDFINWYWDGRFYNLRNCFISVSNVPLCDVAVNGFPSWYSLFEQGPSVLYEKSGVKLFFELCQRRICQPKMSALFERIHKSIETKGWVDIENDYYELLKKYALDNASEAQIDELNTQLHYLQELLVEYLKSINISESLLNTDIRQKIYAPFIKQDISIEGQWALKEHIESGLKKSDLYWDYKLRQYGSSCYTVGYVAEYRVKYNDKTIKRETPPEELLLPNQIMLLNFNYTHTADLYCKKGDIFTVNHIHGDLKDPESVIFGYGDELDEDYKHIVNKNENKFLGHIKSIKYLESDNYRGLLSFVESEPYQIIIMGHSCGNSDRTLLNTLFEHKNCVSIKPYFHQIDKEHDDYIKIVQNISRNFTDMKLMRDRVVNKTYCKPLTR